MVEYQFLFLVTAFVHAKQKRAGSALSQSFTVSVIPSIHKTQGSEFIDEAKCNTIKLVIDWPVNDRQETSVSADDAGLWGSVHFVHGRMCSPTSSPKIFSDLFNRSFKTETMQRETVLSYLKSCCAILRYFSRSAWRNIRQKQLRRSRGELFELFIYSDNVYAIMGGVAVCWASVSFR